MSVTNNSPPLAPQDEPLPPTLTEISEVIGREAALKIAEAVGGTRVYIPGRVDGDHWLAKAVGRDLADKLCRHFCVNGTRGAHIEIPHGPLASTRVMTREREALVVSMSEDGQSARDIALALGITQRTVYAYRTRDRQSRQRRRRR